MREVPSLISAPELNKGLIESKCLRARTANNNSLPIGQWHVPAASRFSGVTGVSLGFNPRQVHWLSAGVAAAP
jgi:hypothetical protein